MNQKNISYLSFAALTGAMLLSCTSMYATDADDKIESSFKKSHVCKTYLKDNSIKVSAKNGTVTLTGTVSEESHKSLAQDTAESLPGVSKVHNELETKAEVDTANADTWIARKVKLALMFHRHVSYSATTVEVKDGIVTLTGEADTASQKDLTSEYAGDVEGVKSVNNQMTIAKAPATKPQTKGEQIDDASVTAQVKAALATHRSTSPIKIKVTTLNGEVTLTGIAKNSTEKSLVTKIVTDIKGVNGVNNKMTI